MNLLNRLSEAKRRACVNGVILYVSTEGRIRNKLESWEKELYKVEFKNDIQYVYENKKQIHPRETQKSKRNSAHKLSDTSDAPMD